MNELERFDRAMRFALDAPTGTDEYQSWACGCRSEHTAGTCVYYLDSCDGTACRRVPPPAPLILTGEE